MQRSSYQSAYQYGWNTTSQEYLDHIRRMQRTPTLVIDGPQYPSAYAPINNSVAREEAREVHRPHKNYHTNHQRQPAPEVVHNTNHQRQHVPEVVHKKVQFAKDDKEIVIDKEKTESLEVKSIDAEADDFINLKHKNFELSKWATFKAY